MVREAGTHRHVQNLVAEFEDGGFNSLDHPDLLVPCTVREQEVTITLILFIGIPLLLE